MERRRVLILLPGAVLAVLLAAVVALLVVGSDEEGAGPGRDSGSGAAEGQAPGVAPAREPFDGFGELALTVRHPDGSSTMGCLLAALSAEQRQRGLMGVTDLDGYDGMAFVYPEDTDTGFYMLDTPMPLSIAWVSADGRLVDTADMVPCEDGRRCPTYRPSGSYRVAIEVPRGELDDLGILPGASISVGGACAGPP